MKHAVPIALAVCGAIGVAIACGGATEHIYPARELDRTRGCLLPIVSLDVVDGPDDGSQCAVVCLVSRLDAGGAPPQIYASSECQPFPPFFDVSGTDPDCPRAIDAWKNGPSCLADGGVGEGGTLDAGADATSDVDGQTDSSVQDTGATDTGSGANDGSADAASE